VEKKQRPKDELWIRREDRSEGKTRGGSLEVVLEDGTRFRSPGQFMSRLKILRFLRQRTVVKEWVNRSVVMFNITELVWGSLIEYDMSKEDL